MPVPEVIAHRGAPRDRVENTLPAFERALDVGADAVELDVHLTADGTAVVHHDPVPRARRTGGEVEPRPIAGLRLAELRDLRFADGSAIPTLDDTLALIAGRATAYVELKGHGVEEAVLDCLDRHRVEAAVHSFDHRAVARVGARRPALRRGILLSSYLVDAPAALRAAGALDLWQEWTWIDRPLVAAVHATGARVIAWTVNDPAAMAALAALGVDGLCSDLPGSVREAVASAGA